jgi:hypothetical protein
VWGNIGTSATNAVGLTNLLFGGKVDFKALLGFYVDKNHILTEEKSLYDKEISDVFLKNQLI